MAEPAHAFDTAYELSLVDPAMDIEDPSDQRLFTSILTRPHSRVSANHILFMRALVERGGKKFIPIPRTK